METALWLILLAVVVIGGMVIRQLDEAIHHLDTIAMKLDEIELNLPNQSG